MRLSQLITSYSRAKDLYDRLMHELFRKFHRIADENHVTVSRRGTSDRNAAIQAALAHAEKEFQSQYGFGRGPWNLRVATPKDIVALQAVDYFLWALQRLYEPRVDARSGQSLRSERFFGVLRAQVAEVHDLSFGPTQGIFFTRQRELTVPRVSARQKTSALWGIAGLLSQGSIVRAMT